MPLHVYEKNAGVWFGVKRSGAPVSFPVVFAGRDKKCVAEEISRRSRSFTYILFSFQSGRVWEFSSAVKKELTHEIVLRVNLPIGNSGRFLSSRCKNCDF